MKMWIKTILTGVLLLLILAGVLPACSAGTTDTTSNTFTGPPDVVEVSYFYESDACFCLKLAGEWINDTINTDYKEQLLAGWLKFYTVWPEVEDTVKLGDAFANIEGWKLSVDIITPVTGKVTQVNAEIVADPELINAFPYLDGWMLVLELTNPEELNDLLSAEEYAILNAVKKES